MSESVLAQIAALKAKSTAELRHMWRELFDREPPVLGRRYLEDRIAYRVQELHFGGLSDRARRKLDALADQLEPKAARRRAPGRPIAGTQLRRHWKNVEHVVTVREHDFEYEGRPTDRCRRSPGRLQERGGTAGCSSASGRTGRAGEPATLQGPLRGLLP